jgi:hypothetical protein
MDIQIMDIIQVIVLVIGGSSLLCKAAEIIAAATETLKDDAIVGSIRAVLDRLQRLLGPLALNPKK